MNSGPPGSSTVTFLSVRPLRAAATAADTPYAPKGALPLPQSVRTVVQGQRADGSPVFAQGVWFARAVGPQMRLYHAVVYTGKPRPELADQFFAGMVLQ